MELYIPNWEDLTLRSSLTSQTEVKVVGSSHFAFVLLVSLLGLRAHNSQTTIDVINRQRDHGRNDFLRPVPLTFDST